MPLASRPPTVGRSPHPPPGTPLLRRGWLWLRPPPPLPPPLTQGVPPLPLPSTQGAAATYCSPCRRFRAPSTKSAPISGLHPPRRGSPPAPPPRKPHPKGRTPPRRAPSRANPPREAIPPGGEPTRREANPTTRASSREDDPPRSVGEPRHEGANPSRLRGRTSLEKPSSGVRSAWWGGELSTGSGIGAGQRLRSRQAVEYEPQASASCLGVRRHLLSSGCGGVRLHGESGP